MTKPKLILWLVAAVLIVLIANFNGSNRSRQKLETEEGSKLEQYSESAERLLENEYEAAERKCSNVSDNGGRRGRSAGPIGPGGRGQPRRYIVERWKGASVLETAERKLAEGRVSRVTVIQPRDLPYPVRIEEMVFTDRKTGEVQTKLISEMVANDFLIGIQSEESLPVIRESLEAIDAKLLGPILKGIYQIVLRETTANGVPSAIDSLASDAKLSESVRFSEPDYITRIAREPSDPLYLNGDLWGQNNEGQAGGLEDIDIDAPEGWEIRTDASAIIVGVVDTGINYLHEDLVANMWSNPGEIADNGIDDDGNGYVDDVFGINAIVDSGDPLDDNGHGTHCSGTVGASGDNGIGVVGVAWDVKLMGLKFMSSDGSGATADAIKCIQYAIENDVDVLSNSWGGGFYLNSLEVAIEAANDAGIVFVAAAGNDRSNNDTTPSYPASYSVSNVVSVASIDRFGELSGFSNFGASSVDIAAPGSDILSTWHLGVSDYNTISGTSMATPQVSGIVAMQMAEFPNDDHLTQIQRLFVSSRKRPSLEGFVATGGLANLNNALNMETVPSPPVILSAFARRVRAIEERSLSLEVAATSDSPIQYVWFKDGAPLVGESSSRLEIDPVSIQDAGEYSIAVSNTDGSVSRSTQLDVFQNRNDLAEAIDRPEMDVITFGESDWTIGEPGRVGSEFAVTQAVSDDSFASIATRLQGPGRLEFYWKVSSEINYDFLRLVVDGRVVDEISGIEDWSRQTVDLSENRAYDIEWRYVKDLSISGGVDRGFLDGFAFLQQSPPEIRLQPANYVTLPGSQALLFVLAEGQALSYQWYKDSVLLAGEVGYTLSIPVASESDTGEYFVEVSNEFGAVKSAAARIAVASLPVEIVTQPQGARIQEGGRFEVGVVATGTQPFAYQWLKNGEEIAGASTSILAIDGVAYGDEGAYSVRVSSPVTTTGTLSENAVLAIGELELAPSIIKQPVDIKVEQGAEGRFAVVATGTRPLTYLWYKDGGEIADSNDSSLLVSNIDATDIGDYKVVVSNALGSSESGIGRLELITGIGESVEQPELEWKIGGDADWIGQTIVSNDGVDAAASGLISDSQITFIETFVEGPVRIRYKWKASTESGYDFLSALLDGVLVNWISGETDWEEQSIDVTENGTHQIRWVYEKDSIFAIGEDKVWVDEIELDYSPLISGHPETRFVEVGESVTFLVEAASVDALSYQWRKDGVAIDGEVFAELTIASVSGSDWGIYDVVVSNEFGSIASDPAQLFDADAIGRSVELENLEWSMGGDNSWFPASPFESFDSIDSLKSGDLDDGEEAWVEAVIEGPVNLKFQWRTSSEEYYDFLFLLVDGEIVGQLSGINFWQEFEVAIPGAGPHTVRWLYSKDGVFSVGGDGAWIDRIELGYQPILVNQPQSTVTRLGERAVLTASVSSISDVDYQWWKDGFIVEGANASELVIDSVDESDLGAYLLAVSNEFGSVDSEEAQLVGAAQFDEALEVGGLDWRIGGEGSWLAADALDAHSGDDILETSQMEPWQSAWLETTVEGPVVVNFQWKHSLGFSFDSFVFQVDGVLVNTNWGGFGWEAVEVEILEPGPHVIRWSYFNDGLLSEDFNRGMLDSLEIRPHVAITRQPRSIFLSDNDSGLFSVEAVSQVDLSYQWRFDGVDISGATESMYSIDSLIPDELGEYDVVVTNGEFTVISNPVASIYYPHMSSSIDYEDLTWSTGGEGYWSPFRADWASDGVDFVATSAIGDDESAWVETTIWGPAKISFDWAASSESNYDGVAFYVNEKEIDFISGELAWETLEYEIQGSGEFTLKWEYSKDGSISDGIDAGFIDKLNIEFSEFSKYSVWLLGKEIFSEEPVVRTVGADPDGDGVPNVLEYVLGLDPSVEDAPKIFSLVAEEESVTLKAEFVPVNDVSDLEFAIEISEDLLIWEEPILENESIGDVTAETSSVVLSSRLSREQARRIFARLTVKLPED